MVNDAEVTGARDSESHQDASEDGEEKARVLKQPKGGKGKSLKEELAKANAFHLLKPPPPCTPPQNHKWGMLQPSQEKEETKTGGSDPRA